MYVFVVSCFCVLLCSLFPFSFLLFFAVLLLCLVACLLFCPFAFLLFAFLCSASWCLCFFVCLLCNLHASVLLLVCDFSLQDKLLPDVCVCLCYYCLVKFFGLRTFNGLMDRTIPTQHTFSGPPEGNIQSRKDQIDIGANLLWATRG